MQMPQTILFVLPHLKAGGIEFIVRELVNRLDRSRWRPVLCLASATGDLLSGVADDVSVIDNGGARASVMIARLPGIMRREKAALVYVGTNAMNIAVLLAFKGMRKAGRPGLIVSEHTSAAPYLEKARHGALRRRLVSWLYPGADVLAFPLDALAEEWVHLIGRCKAQVAVLHNPVLDRGEVARITADPPTRMPHHIVTAGRLVSDKGHDILIRSMAQLRERLPTATLDIFGSGPEEPTLRQHIKAAGLEDAVFLRGFSNDLLAEFARADVVALPSLREGFGNVLIEALAMGARVVASDCPGPRAILRGGDLGALVQPGDAEALAEALAHTLTRPRTDAPADAVEFSLRPYYKDAAVVKFDELARSICPAPI